MIYQNIKTAFSKSKKFTKIYLCHSLPCSRIFRSVNMRSVVPLPGLNPACSFRSISSTASVMRIMTTLQNTLLGIESNVTPLQTLHSVRFPFFGIWTVFSCVHSRGSSSFSHMSKNKGWRTSLASSGLALRSSAGIASWPGALLFFRALMALRISCQAGVYPPVQIFLGW